MFTCWREGCALTWRLLREGRLASFIDGHERGRDGRGGLDRLHSHLAGVDGGGGRSELEMEEDWTVTWQSWRKRWKRRTTLTWQALRKEEMQREEWILS